MSQCYAQMKIFFPWIDICTIKINKYYYQILVVVMGVIVVVVVVVVVVVMVVVAAAAAVVVVNVSFVQVYKELSRIIRE